MALHVFRLRLWNVYGFHSTILALTLSLCSVFFHIAVCICFCTIHKISSILRYFIPTISRIRCNNCWWIIFIVSFSIYSPVFFSRFVPFQILNSMFLLIDRYLLSTWHLMRIKKAYRKSAVYTSAIVLLNVRKYLVIF